MNRERLLLDTVFVQALLNRGDRYHNIAKRWLPRTRVALEVWITEAVLIEIGNALRAINRSGAVAFIEQCYKTENIHVVSINTALLKRGLALYRDRPDEKWSLTDCLSFIVMEDEGITNALTMDEHFRQSGYRTLMEE